MVDPSPLISKEGYIWNIRRSKSLEYTETTKFIRNEDEKILANQKKLKNERGFWIDKTSWKKRKQLALDAIKNVKGDISHEYYILDLAYNRKCNDIDFFYAIHSNKFKRTRLYDLTPLIFAIWGEIDNNDSEKETSKLLLDICLREDQQIAGNKYSTIRFRNSIIPTANLKIIEKELGHCIIHDILGGTNLEYFTDIELIKYNFSAGLQYLIEEKKIFELHKCVDKSLFYDFQDVNNNKYSQIYLSIKSKSVSCTDVILKHIIKSINNKKERFTKFDIITEEFPYIISSSSEYLLKLLDIIMISSNYQLYFPYKQLPIIKFLHLNQADYPDSQYIFKSAHDLFQQKQFDDEYSNTDIFVSLIKLPSISGSAKSVEFLEGLCNTVDIKIFRSQIIKFYLKKKWNSLWWFIFLEAVLTWSNLPMIALMIFTDNHSIYLMIIFLLVNFLLFTLEVMQLCSIGIYNYFGKLNEAIALILFNIGLLSILPFAELNLASFFLYTSTRMLMFHRVNKEHFWFSVIFVVVCLLYSLPGFFNWNSPYMNIPIGIITTFILIYFISYYKRKVASKKWFKNDYEFICLHAVKVVLTVIYCLLKDKYYISIVLLSVYSSTFTEKSIRVIINPMQNEFSNWFVDTFIMILFILSYFLSDFLDFEAQITLWIFFVIVNYLEYKMLKTNFLLKSNQIGQQKRSISWKISLLYHIQITVLLIASLSQIFYFNIALILFIMYQIVKGSLREKRFTKDIREDLSKFFFNWNTLDVARLALTIEWLIYYNSNENSVIINAILLGITFIRGLTGFKSFDTSRFYIRLILNSVSEIKYFLLIFFYSTFAFGLVIYSLNHVEGFDLEKIWVSSYDISLGEMTHDNSLNWSYLVFIIATIFNVIVMLNLLISILGDSFDKFQVSAIEYDHLEMAESLRDIEIALNTFKSSRNTYNYISACDISLEQGKKDWEGKVIMIEKNIKKEIKPIRNGIKNIEKALKIKDDNYEKKKKIDIIEKQKFNRASTIFYNKKEWKKDNEGISENQLENNEKIISLRDKISHLKMITQEQEKTIKEQEKMIKKQSDTNKAVLEELEMITKQLTLL